MTAAPTRTLLDGTRITDHRIAVPLDWSDPEGDQIDLFAREYLGAEAAKAGQAAVARMPWLLYLQGGPGGKGARPARLSGWMEEAATRFRILMLDQRGTGLSTPLSRRSPLLRGASPEHQAQVMRRFRADSIICDAEAFRQELQRAGHGTETWSVLGQSFGGFCTLTYLSRFPESLDRALLTGGLPPLTGHADRVYRHTYTKMRARNADHFARFPEDREQLDEVVGHLRTATEAGDPVLLPDGSPLTTSRVQMLGMLLGGNTRADTLHHLLEEAFVLPRVAAGPPQLSDTFLEAVHGQLSFAANPLYALMHESIYGQPAAVAAGDVPESAEGATAWSAERVLTDFPEFSATSASPLLTGEMIFPEHVALDPALAPLARSAEVLADVEDWEPLYDLGQLAQNAVPAAAAVYTDDVYVARELSLETAERVAGLSVWETGEFHHDGLSDDGPRILRELLARTDAE